jgi:virulence-associated protein VapD
LNQTEFPRSFKKRGVVYALAIDLDTNRMPDQFDCDECAAHAQIQRILDSHGFEQQNGSLYFGSEAVNAVSAVLAASDLAARLPWFATSLRDIRMLRIEEMNDLMPVLQQIAKSSRQCE